jgi:beta-galactosidase
MKRIPQFLFFAFLIFFTCVNSYSQSTYKKFSDKQLRAVVPSANRFVHSLAGNWDMTFDGGEWITVTIPYSNPINETITFTKVVKIDKNMIDNLAWHLYFLGVDDQVQVYVNNQFVGSYFGCSTPFYVRIPNRMLQGESNTIKLVLTPAEHSSKQSRQQNVFSPRIYTGVLRELFLVGTPNVWVSDIKYSSKIHKNLTSADIDIKLKISTATVDNLLSSLNRDSLIVKNLKDVSVLTEVRNYQTGEVLAASSTKVLQLENERTGELEYKISLPNPVLWSPGNPHLYLLTAKITKNGFAIDDYSVNLGIRNISTINSGTSPYFAINGQKIEIKGVDYYEDYVSNNSTLSPYRMESDIKQIKTLGANTIRFKNTPPHPYMAHLCDKYGIMMMLELPVLNMPEGLVASNEILVRMKNCADRLTATYSNCSSLIAWGLSDGLLEGMPSTANYESKIAPIFKKTHNKLIYKTVVLSDHAVDHSKVDFVILRDNWQVQNPVDLKTEFSKIKEQVNPKPLILNFGLVIQPKNHDGYSDPHSVESQANYIRNLYHLSKDIETAGCMVWAFNDFVLENPLMLLNLKDQYHSTPGLTDRQRNERLSFTTLQSLFNKEKEPLLNAGSYSDSAPIFFVIAGILIAAILIFMLNRFKRYREYMFRSILRPYNFYADIRDQRIMSSIQTVTLGFVISISVGLYMASLLYFFRNSDTAQYLIMMLLPSSALQEILYGLIWNPELFSLVLALMYFAVVFLLAGFLRITTFFIRGRIFFNDTLTIAIWAGIPLIILLPFATVLVRILILSPAVLWFVAILFTYLAIWSVFRLLRSTTVVFDIAAYKIYLVAFFLLALVSVLVLAFYHLQFSIITYFDYFLKANMII